MTAFFFKKYFKCQPNFFRIGLASLPKLILFIIQAVLEFCARWEGFTTTVAQ